MKTFKTIDWIVQLGFMIAPPLLYLVNVLSSIDNNLIARDMLLIFYFGVGSCQITSVIIHFFLPSTVRIRMRKVYLILLALTFLIGIIFTLPGYVLYFLAGLLFWSPVLALIYLITCITETKKMNTILS